MDGRPLTFRLIGINNQNFLMEDAETGSWWQQVSGQAVHGPLAGRRLTQVLHDEVTFGLWKREHPEGRVLALKDEASQIRADWEVSTGRYPVNVTPARGSTAGTTTGATTDAAADTATGGASTRLEPRTLIAGLVVDGQAKAYPLDRVVGARAVMDQVKGTPIALLAGADGHSVRAFDRRIDGRTLELLARPDSSPARFIDSETGSEWDIAGRAVAGPLAGRTLTRLPLLSDYWFDWQIYHPDSLVHREWQPLIAPSAATP